MLLWNFFQKYFCNVLGDLFANLILPYEPLNKAFLQATQTSFFGATSLNTVHISWSTKDGQVKACSPLWGIDSAGASWRNLQLHVPRRNVYSSSLSYQHTCSAIVPLFCLFCPSLATTLYHLSRSMRIPRRKNDSSFEAIQELAHFLVFHGTDH